MRDPTIRRRTGGVGKLFFLSIASTFFSKRWKSASALERMGISSMVLESSLTRFVLVSDISLGLRRTNFKEEKGEYGR